MIPACVVDASVAIKWVVREDGSEAADRLRRAGTVLHAPDLIYPELGNILWKKLIRAELSRERAEIALHALALAPLRMHASASHLAQALRIALDMRHPVYDALYLAVGQALNVPVITADRALVAKAARASIAGDVLDLAHV